ncbi:MAG TPA: sensor domain-containing protein [Pseudonocardiaceae bacterium]
MGTARTAVLPRLTAVTTAEPAAVRLRRAGQLAGLIGMAPVCLATAGLTVSLLGMAWTWVALPLLVAVLAGGRALADGYREVAGALLGEHIESPYRPLHDDRLVTRVIGPLRDPATWRDLAWLWVNGTLGVAMHAAALALLLGGCWQLVLPAVWAAWPDTFHDYYGFLPVNSLPMAVLLAWPLAAAHLAAWWKLEPVLTRSWAQLARSLLASTERSRLIRRVHELSESRAETVDTQAAELRRIERDLHDGAQARLVALGMSLGLADEVMERDPQAARALLAEARAATSTALAELRDLVRGIHPPVLADRGLEGAVQALALASPLPVEVQVDVPGRLPAPVESAAYFAVAEAITNVIKHSGAATAWVRLTWRPWPGATAGGRAANEVTDGRLVLLVMDDGCGGADPNGGTGLRGIERRLGAFDGTVVVSSPQGGPTVVTMELPCASSSPRTSPS